jgi:hypothetical protein
MKLLLGRYLRDGTRVGWSKVKDGSWYEREAWPFDRR